MRFLYQLGSHIIDSAYFSTQCTLTTNCDTWFYAYKELSWCAYDTTWMESDSSVYARACSVYADTVTFGMMNWKYNSLKYSAFSSDVYFNFDLTNNQLISNNSNQTDAYVIGEIFMSSPLVASSQTNSPIFKISPSFIFSTSDDLDYMISMYDCFIDFDDGSGPQLISLSTTNYHQVTYSTPGYHIFQTTIRLHSDTSVVVKRSNSGFVVSSTPAISPQEYTDLSSQFQGLKVYHFNPECNLGMKDDKIIFILAGYNMGTLFNNHIRSVSTLYENYIVKGRREILRQFGYSFVLVEWEDADRAIEQNAAYVVNLLEYYKCNKVGNEQFVLIGESMGSLVGRYALTYMESPSYVSPNDCCLNLKHNVRLFISNDGPHLGANIPLSLQEGVAAIENVAEFGAFLGDMLCITALSCLNVRNRSLNGTSVKQMLLYHYSTGNNGYYTAHPYHDVFLHNLEGIGGYPHLCKNVALSNGSLQGRNQQQCFDTLDAGASRVPNDRFLGVNITSEFHVLGISLRSGTSVDLRSNPYGSGQLASISVGTQMPSISLYFWGVNVSYTNTPLVSFSKYGYNLQPFCVSAGGAIWLLKNGYAGGSLGAPLDFGNFLFGIHGSSNLGSLSATLDYGIPWLFGGSLSGSIYTDGLGFCLVPVQSAFCYDANHWDLQRDYTILSTTTMFNNTFFDVLSGHPDRDGRHRYNGLHETYRNKVFINQINDDTIYSHQYYKNSTCEETECRILNREVGDEELFLDNSQINGVASYSALVQLYVNVPHPYYNFDGQISTTYKIPGMYCRTDPFIINYPGLAIFQSNMLPDTHEAIGNYESLQTLYLGCCEKRFEEPVPEIGVQSTDSSIIVYPNPIGVGEELQIVSSKHIYNIKMYDIAGYQMATIPVDNETGIIFVTIPTTITAGIYNLYCAHEEGVSSLQIYVY